MVWSQWHGVKCMGAYTLHNIIVSYRRTSVCWLVTVAGGSSSDGVTIVIDFSQCRALCAFQTHNSNLSSNLKTYFAYIWLLLINIMNVLEFNNNTFAKHFENIRKPCNRMYIRYEPHFRIFGHCWFEHTRLSITLMQRTRALIFNNKVTDRHRPILFWVCFWWLFIRGCSLFFESLVYYRKSKDSYVILGFTSTTYTIY